MSSDWDEDPKSYDPPLGEQSSTRDPFNDWRPCTPPPWIFRCLLTGWETGELGAYHNVDNGPDGSVMNMPLGSALTWQLLRGVFRFIQLPGPVVHNFPIEWTVEKSKGVYTMGVVHNVNLNDTVFQTWRGRKTGSTTVLELVDIVGGSLTLPADASITILDP